MSDTFKVGNVTRDPELRFGANGKAVLSFSIAENRRRAGEDEVTMFHNVVCFGSLAENVAASIPKGTRVIVVGDLTQRSYEDKEGNKRQAVEITAWNVGPDLSWATADVTKAESSGGNKPSKSQAARAKQESVYGDEEPF